MAAKTPVDELLAEVDELRREAEAVYRCVVEPNWNGELHGLRDALYGYMMGVFSKMDLASAYWQGTYDDQTVRLVAFMDEFLPGDHVSHSVAVQMWRHKLMHTSKPRYLTDAATGIVYRWLLHWWHQLPQEQHFTMAESGSSRVLNLGLIYLIDDLRAAIEQFGESLRGDPASLARCQSVERELGSYKFKDV